MLSIVNSHYYNLNPVASQIWFLLEKPLTIENIAIQIHNKFDCTYTEALLDTIDFLYHLAKNSLMKFI